MALYIQKLEQAKKDSDRKEFSRVWKESKETARKAKKLSRRVSVEFLETQLKLRTLYWLRGKQNKALQHWSKSIEHGKKYARNYILNMDIYQFSSIVATWVYRKLIKRPCYRVNSFLRDNLPYKK
jgi:hypothetical protein